MNSLRTLGILAIGVFCLAAFFSFTTTEPTTSTAKPATTERSVQHVRHGEGGEFTLTEDDRTLLAKWQGDFTPADDGRSLIRLDSWLAIKLEEDGAWKKAEFKNVDGAVVGKLKIDGRDQPINEDTNAQMSALLMAFFQESGVKTKDRILRLVEKEGVDGAFREIREIDNPHAAAQYALALVKYVDLTEPQLHRLLSNTEPFRQSHSLSRLVRAIIVHQDLPPTLTPSLIEASLNIEDDHDRRKIIEKLASEPLSDDALSHLLALYSSIESDHDARLSAQALLTQSSINNDFAIELLTLAADDLKSEHDLKSLLSGCANRLSSEAFRATWFAAFDRIQSDHDRRMAITAAANAGKLDDKTLLLLIEKAKGLDASHEQYMALSAIADQTTTPSPALMTAFENAARSIEADHERDRTLRRLADLHDQ